MSVGVIVPVLLILSGSCSREHEDFNLSREFSRWKNFWCSLFLPRVEISKVLFLLSYSLCFKTERIQNVSDAGSADKSLKNN